MCPSRIIVRGSESLWELRLSEDAASTESGRDATGRTPVHIEIERGVEGKKKNLSTEQKKKEVEMTKKSVISGRGFGGPLAAAWPLPTCPLCWCVPSISWPVGSSCSAAPACSPRSCCS